MEAFMTLLRRLREQFLALSSEEQENALAAMAETVGSMRYVNVRHRFEKEVELTLAWEAERMIVERISSDFSSLGAYSNISSLDFESTVTSFQESRQKERDGFIWSDVYDKGISRVEDNTVLYSLSSVDEESSEGNLESTAYLIDDTGHVCNKVICPTSNGGSEIGKENRLTCVTCGFLASNRKALYRHGLKTHHLLRVRNCFGSLACEFCSFRTNKMFNYNRHMKRFHLHQRWELLDRVPSPSTRHVLEESGPAAKTRKRCIGCYKNLAKYNDSRTAAKRAKRINTRCSQCKKHFCVDCFTNSHRKCKL